MSNSVKHCDALSGVTYVGGALGCTSDVCTVYASDLASVTEICHKKEKMPSSKAKSWLYRKDNDTRLWVKTNDGNGYVDNDVCVMPDIIDVSIIENNGVKQVVVVEFADHSTEKAVVDACDTFSFENGVSICIAKKMFSKIVGNKNGSSVYNKVVERCLKLYEKKRIAAMKVAAEEAEKKQRYLKLIEKKRNKRIRRENEAREELINIQKEAFLRALREYNTIPAE